MNTGSLRSFDFGSESPVAKIFWQAKKGKDCKLYTASIGHRIARVLFGKRRSRAGARSGLGAKKQAICQKQLFVWQKIFEVHSVLLAPVRVGLLRFNHLWLHFCCILTPFLFSHSLTNSQARSRCLFQEWRHLNGNCPSSTITGCVQ